MKAVSGLRGCGWSQPGHGSWKADREKHSAIPGSERLFSEVSGRRIMTEWKRVKNTALQLRGNPARTDPKV